MDMHIAPDAPLTGIDVYALPPEEGETPVGRTFVKQRCSKDIAGLGHAFLEAHYFRKKGQSQFDPRTGRRTQGQFESLTRFELLQD